MAEILRHTDSGASVFIATPVYDSPSPAYTKSLYATREAMSEAGIRADLCILSGDCHVDDARNRLFGEFLKTDCEKLVFLDADLSWRAEDFLDLISHDVGIVAGVYRKRGKGGYAVNHLPGYQETGPNGLVEVAGAATGFMCISREVVETLATQGFIGQSGTWSPLICERTRIGQTRFGGDYELCRKWREHGKVYVNPFYRFSHAGYSGCYASHRKLETGQLIPECLQKIAEGTETMDTFRDLSMAWGNPYAGTPEFLCAAVEMAREADSVLELGSGLSTMCLAAVGPVTTVEDSEDWLNYTKARIEPYVDEVTFIHAPLVRGFYHADLDGYDLVVCDGPDRKKGDRSQAQSIQCNKLLIDDCDASWKADMITSDIGVIAA